MVHGLFDAGSVLKRYAGLTDSEINSLDRETAIEAAEAVESQHEVLLGSWPSEKIRQCCNGLAKSFLKKEFKP